MSKYELLAAKLTEKITENLEIGIYKLPTEAELSRQYKVSRQTVRSALALLHARGIIVSRQGSGSYATGLSEDNTRNVIPILIANHQEYIYPHLLTDIRNALSAQGYQLQVYDTCNNTTREREHLLTLLTNPPRGMIVEGCKSALPNPNLDLYEKLRAAGCFLLFLHNSYAALPDTVCVKDDNYYGGYLLAEHLVSLGHTRIAGFFKMDDLQGPERYFGVASCLRDLEIVLEDSHVGWFTSLDVETLESRQDTRFLTTFIQEQLQDCTAIVCYNDEIAYWLMKELSYAGRQVPQEISVVCFDNSYLSDLSRIRITTLTHKPHEMGDCVAECMIQKLKGIPVVSQEIPWQLVRKESDAPYQP
ncbi:MAG: GntR family transcriptional regulator [Lachnospiraceae bacterium]|nr:GntR family transcriptional regulator [Lachnospiraceae bacterium]